MGCSFSKYNRPDDAQWSSWGFLPRLGVDGGCGTQLTSLGPSRQITGAQTLGGQSRTTLLSPMSTANPDSLCHRGCQPLAGAPGSVTVTQVTHRELK